MGNSDRDLGMDARITRRDFVQGVAMLTHEWLGHGLSDQKHSILDDPLLATTILAPGPENRGYNFAYE
jgi:hypothetical protein